MRNDGVLEDWSWWWGGHHGPSLHRARPALLLWRCVLWYAFRGRGAGVEAHELRCERSNQLRASAKNRVVSLPQRPPGCCGSRELPPAYERSVRLRRRRIEHPFALGLRRLPELTRTGPAGRRSSQHPRLYSWQARPSRVGPEQRCRGGGSSHIPRWGRHRPQGSGSRGIRVHVRTARLPLEGTSVGRFAGGPPAQRRARVAKARGRARDHIKCDRGTRPRVEGRAAMWRSRHSLLCQQQGHASPMGQQPRPSEHNVAAAARAASRPSAPSAAPARPSTRRAVLQAEGGSSGGANADRVQRTSSATPFIEFSFRQNEFSPRSP